MSRRIDIELTSRTADGGFTWRAAGAKQPRGTLGAEMLPAGAAVGDLLRAELESGLDGLEVVSVLARPEKKEERAANRIEVMGAPRRAPEISVSYASPARRRPDMRREADEMPERLAGRRERTTRRDGGARRPLSGRSHVGIASETREERTEREGRAVKGGRVERPQRPSGRGGGRRIEHGARGERPPYREGVGETEDRRHAGGRRTEGPERRPGPVVRKERRPTISAAHRNALLATLGPQELPVAEQLLRGGIPAVRQALAEQGARPGALASETANADAVLAIADQLLPRVNLATWKDRASSAQAAGKELRLRELRAVVTASRTVTLDDEARAMARALRESLEQRVQALREEWLGRMSKALDEGRVVDALRVSSRPPEPATRLPAEVAVGLADAAGSAMTADSEPGAWMELLQAVVDSAVRRTVKPRGIPDTPEAKDAARHAAGSVPELAKLLGLPIPPPPPPRRTRAGGPRPMAVGGAGRAAGR